MVNPFLSNGLRWKEAYLQTCKVKRGQWKFNWMLIPQCNNSPELLALPKLHNFSWWLWGLACSKYHFRNIWQAHWGTKTMLLMNNRVRQLYSKQTLFPTTNLTRIQQEFQARWKFCVLEWFHWFVLPNFKLNQIIQNSQSSRAINTLTELYIRLRQGREVCYRFRQLL